MRGNPQDETKMTQTERATTAPEIVEQVKKYRAKPSRKISAEWAVTVTMRSKKGRPVLTAVWKTLGEPLELPLRVAFLPAPVLEEIQANANRCLLDLLASAKADTTPANAPKP